MSKATQSNPKDADKGHKNSTEECNELKEKGDTYMSQGKYAEAAIHYTFAMENFPHSELHLLHNNRSMALLKAEQYYFALADAEKAIELAPTWPKGFLRKAEVQYQAGFYADAIKSYNQARVRDATDKSIADCVKKANRQLIKATKERARRPWLFTASSLLLAVLLIVADYFITQFLLLQYIFIKLIVLVLFGGLGYTIARIYQYTVDKQLSMMLEEPIDLFGTNKPKAETQSSDDEKTTGAASHNKSHKAQSSRHRHRRGRS